MWCQNIAQNLDFFVNGSGIRFVFDSDKDLKELKREILFFQSLHVSTLYTNLGDEAIIHGINETEVIAKGVGRMVGGGLTA